jgi:hypothetical protein
MTGEAFERSIVDGFTAAAVLLAAITVLFGVRYPEVTGVLAEPKPGNLPGDKDNRESYRKRLRTALYGKLLPLLILFWAFALLPLPQTARIFQELNLKSDYDFIRAAWVVTEVMMFYFAGWSSWLALQLRKAMREAPK